MRWKTIALLTTAFIAVGAAFAVADSVDEEAREAFANSDRNGDGKIDRDEFYVRMVEVFYHSDTNKDGFLDLPELQKIDEDMVFEPADVNGDGKLSLTEYVNQRFESFDETDVNSDGVLSVEEVLNAYEGG
jgi:Ca2+-binding EF-hand superfamily protein